MTLANYLYSLAYSDTYLKNDWQDWATRLLEKNIIYNEDTAWLFDVVFAGTKKKLFNVISKRMTDENYNYYHEITRTEIIQGYYYSAYLNEKIDRYQLLEKSGDVSDAGQDEGELGCEFFYRLLNELTNNPTKICCEAFNHIIKNTFEHSYDMAMVQKNKLENCTFDDIISLVL